ncbi:MAG: hypothetical protein ABSA84_02950 [Gammaproteobacteria bacterium]|jgi:ribosomal protein S15P/S13E
MPLFKAKEGSINEQLQELSKYIKELKTHLEKDDNDKISIESINKINSFLSKINDIATAKDKEKIEKSKQKTLGKTLKIKERLQKIDKDVSLIHTVLVLEKKLLQKLSEQSEQIKSISEQTSLLISRINRLSGKDSITSKQELATQIEKLKQSTPPTTISDAGGALLFKPKSPPSLRSNSNSSLGGPSSEEGGASSITKDKKQR